MATKRAKSDKRKGEMENVGSRQQQIVAVKANVVDGMSKEGLVVMIKRWEATTGERCGYQIRQKEDVCRFTTRIPRSIYNRLKGGRDRRSINEHMVVALGEYLERHDFSDALALGGNVGVSPIVSPVVKPDAVSQIADRLIPIENRLCSLCGWLQNRKWYIVHGEVGTEDEGLMVCPVCGGRWKFEDLINTDEVGRDWVPDGATDGECDEDDGVDGADDVGAVDDTANDANDTDALDTPDASGAPGTYHPVCFECGGKNTTWCGDFDTKAYCLDCKEEFGA
jgi:hypothetical protein